MEDTLIYTAIGATIGFIIGEGINGVKDQKKRLLVAALSIATLILIWAIAKYGHEL